MSEQIPAQIDMMCEHELRHELRTALEQCEKWQWMWHKHETSMNKMCGICNDRTENFFDDCIYCPISEPTPRAKQCYNEYLEVCHNKEIRHEQELDALKRAVRSAVQQCNDKDEVIDRLRGAIDVDTGKSVIYQLWKDTRGLVPSTGKAWIVSSMIEQALGQADGGRDE
jgi:hypothetical protein